MAARGKLLGTEITSEISWQQLPKSGFRRACGAFRRSTSLAEGLAESCGSSFPLEGFRQRLEIPFAEAP